VTEDLDKYYEKITYINKDVAVYEDDEGNYFNLSPANLLASISEVNVTPSTR
jgi:hypothetical protein